MKWTAEAIDTLETMWLWGHSSGTIAHVLAFPSRNAVMGKLNRLGLMRRGGEYVGARLAGAKIDLTIMTQELEGLTQSKFRWADATDRALMIHMTALFVGHDAETIAAAINRPLDEVARVVTAMDTTGVWKIGTKPPAKWWDNVEGNTAFLLDAMTTAGLIQFEQRGDERFYSKMESSDEAVGKLVLSASEPDPLTVAA